MAESQIILYFKLRITTKYIFNTIANVKRVNYKHITIFMNLLCETFVTFFFLIVNLFVLMKIQNTTQRPAIHKYSKKLCGIGINKYYEIFIRKLRRFL